MSPRSRPPFGRHPEFPEWCLVCNTRHSVDTRCPGEIRVTGPERYGWKVVVETPRTMEAYVVLVAPAGDLWRARILTFPRSLWTVPGGHGTLKFLEKTPQKAEEEAIRFIEEHCARRGYLLRHGLDVAETDPETRRDRAGRPSRAGVPTAPPRWPLVLPVRFGLDVLTLRAVTRNISAGGVFVQTPSPMEPGLDILLRLALQTGALALEGSVVWSRRGIEVGRPPGMGVRLIMPPAAYVEYIRSLPAPGTAEGFSNASRK